MSFPAWLRLRSVPAGRLSIVAAALAAYIVAAVGVPLPTFRAKDRSQPFPCMDRPCGCKSAAACWTSCCCTTPEERLHWAHEHGVEPPSALLAAVSQVAEPDHQSARACCAHRSSPAGEPVGWGAAPRATARTTASALCAKHAAKAASAHCTKPHCVKPCCADHGSHHPATADREPTDDEADFVVISAMRQCKGLSPLWSSLSAATPPPLPVRYEFEWRPAGRVELVSDSAPSANFSPAVPPPKA
ncbi:MAG TPA: hypothetical protein VMV10_27945 [Pirellulales bacterium]|nr:hypothetical protein [Pirellulales bacterium]